MWSCSGLLCSNIMFNALKNDLIPSVGVAPNLYGFLMGHIRKLYLLSTKNSVEVAFLNG